MVPLCGHRCLPRRREPLPFRDTITRALFVALLGTACQRAPSHVKMLSISCTVISSNMMPLGGASSTACMITAAHIVRGET